DTAAGFTYDWAVGGTNGSPVSGPSFSFTPDDSGTYTITLTARDKDGDTGSTTQTITVTNVPPVASLSGPGSGVLYQPLTFTLGAAAPSPADQAAGFTFAVNWGDGGSTTLTGLSGSAATHGYTVAGTYTVTITATDKDGGASAAVTQTVSVSATPLLENGIL